MKTKLICKVTPMSLEYLVIIYAVQAKAQRGKHCRMITGFYGIVNFCTCTHLSVLRIYV
jgi:hypothetical protein